MIRCSAVIISTAGAGNVVDVNLEGGENRVDIDLFDAPTGEHAAQYSTDSDATQIAKPGIEQHRFSAR